MSMLDRLRETSLPDDDVMFDGEIEELQQELHVPREAVEERRIFGLGAVERMLLSILLFITTSALGILILVALQRIDIGL
jgi:hypothetical protein